jgi:uncharacterized protein involved in exopolysaccharide biosynthesis
MAHTLSPSGWSPARRTIEEWTAALLRQWRVVTICFVALSAGALAALMRAPTFYEADMRILVKRDRVDPIISGTPDAARRNDLSEAELLSQVELLKSNDLLEKVAIDAGLDRLTAAASKNTSPEESLAAAVEALQSRLTVAPIKRTWMIAITYKSEDRDRARRVLNTLARLYLEKHLALSRPAGTYDFSSQQTALARQELDAAQAKLEAFSRGRRVVSAVIEKQNVLQKLAEFEAMRQQARATLSESKDRVSALDVELARAPARRTSQVRTADHAGLLQELQTRLLTLESKRTELLKKFTPQYRAVIEIDEQVSQARAALDQIHRTPIRDETEIENPTKQWVDTELARARAERAALTARVRALGDAVTSYRGLAQRLEVDDVEQQDLARAVKAAETKYLLYEQKQEEARISDALDRTRIANVAIAQAPRVPFSSHRSRSLLWLLVLLPGALGLSLAIAVAVDALAPGVRTPDELEAAINAPILLWEARHQPGE